MRHTNINSKYTYLSYVWGQPKVTHRIVINGRSFYVCQNLLDFLEEASQSYPGQSFWIDALCVYQQSISEKNHQVQQMGLIFQHAEKVVAWLGKEAGIVRFVEHPEEEGNGFYDFWNAE
ncbi:heterokaryon incompatibility [Stagonosporopsis vannaccii]|nr:heterokaryon incompatibility [Stagonosporopsis vannaccii]